MSDVRTELRLAIMANAREIAQVMLNEVKLRLDDCAVDNVVLALVEAGLQHLESRGKSFSTIKVGNTITLVADDANAVRVGGDGPSE